ncbi:MAG: hypothetical protein BGO01_05805 [Armatimonadetes bacterium 55-13]|nr:TlpA family protein disulfide reductase [Armatimonadota bacterium]OJU61582.1 MAG: hypothetical protein BGO01_05805 [Armatimonadetes bacterium 55-13]
MLKRVLTIPLMLLSVPLFSQDVEFPVYKFRNKPMPDFKMVSTKGKPYSKSSLKGKVILMDFWATWCGPCIGAMPTMEKLHKKYAGKGLVVIGANILENRNKEQMAGKFLKSKPFTYVFTKDTPNNEALAKKLEIQGIPTLLLIDKKGTVRWVKCGFEPKEEKELAAQIEKLLK